MNHCLIVKERERDGDSKREIDERREAERGTMFFCEKVEKEEQNTNK